MPIRRTEWEGVYADQTWLYTRNLVPGVAVYGESLIREGEDEFRRWDANRSKCAAYLKRGGRHWPFRASSSVLYLGAGTGTTVSHLSDICQEGRLLAVEFSQRAFRDLIVVAERRSNLLPVFGDASKPHTYRSRSHAVDVLYQDVAQRDQVGIFQKNIDSLRSGGTGLLMIKARSTDVAAAPPRVYNEAREAVLSAGLSVLDLRPLAPYQTDHAALMVRKP